MFRVGGIIFALLSVLASARCDIIELDPVYAVHHSIVEKTTIAADGRYDVISESILDALNAGDLTTAIRRVPGVSISRYNQIGAYGGSDGGGVFIRGHGSGRPGADISTMIDGVPLFVGVWTHPLIDTLSVDLAKSIEVYKSPQPVRVGTMGFGAVNIIPKTADVEHHHGEFEGSIGDFDTRLLRGEYSYLQQDFGLVVSASYRESEGHRQNADGEVDAFYGHLSYQLSEHWRASFLASVTDSWANDPEAVGESLPVVENYQTENVFLLGKLVFEGEKFDFEGKYHFEDGKGSWNQWHQAPPPPFPSQSLLAVTDYTNFGVKTRLLSKTQDDVAWTAGIDWDRFGGEVNEIYEIAANNVFEDEQFELFAPYLNVKKTLLLGETGTAVDVAGGARYMVHSVFDSEFVGQLGAVLKRSKWQGYLQFSQSSNYPGVYASVFGRRGPPWQVGDNWRELEAEQVRHYEIGLKLLSTESLEIDLSLFTDDVQNAIHFVTPPPSGYILNIGEYQTEGAELLVHLKQNWWSFFAGFTLLNSDEEIPNLPELSSTLGVHLQMGNWSFVGDIQLVSSQYAYNSRFAGSLTQIDDYQLLSAKVAYQVKQEKYAFEYYLRGENLTNSRYEYRPDYPMPGANFTAGVKFIW